MALYYARDGSVRDVLRGIQNSLFAIGAGLASPEARLPAARLRRGEVGRLEDAIDDIGERMPKLKKFVIPGGCEASVHLHLARTIARRAERSVVAVSKKQKIGADVMSYMNRASSYLFVAALYLDYLEGVRESHPSY